MLLRTATSCAMNEMRLLTLTPPRQIKEIEAEVRDSHRLPPPSACSR